MLTMRDLIPWGRGRDVAAGRTAEHPLVSFQRDMDRLFEDLWRGFDAPLLGRSDRTKAMISPRIELKEKDDEIVVSAELPGLHKKDIEVTLTDNVLSVRGEKKLEKSLERRGIRLLGAVLWIVRAADPDRRGSPQREGDRPVRRWHPDGHSA